MGDLSQDSYLLARLVVQHIKQEQTSVRIYLEIEINARIRIFNLNRTLGYYLALLKRKVLFSVENSPKWFCLRKGISGKKIFFFKASLNKLTARNLYLDSNVVQ